jgi:hypothetical protein
MIGDLVSIFVCVRSIERGFGANLKGTDPSDFGSSTDPDSDEVGDPIYIFELCEFQTRAEAIDVQWPLPNNTRRSLKAVLLPD